MKESVLIFSNNLILCPATSAMNFQDQQKQLYHGYISEKKAAMQMCWTLVTFARFWQFCFMVDFKWNCSGKEINLWERQSRKIISSSFGVRHRNISWYSGYKIFFIKNLILNLKFSNYFGILLIHFRPMFDLCRNQVVGFY